MPRIPDSRTIFEAGIFRLTMLTAGKFVATIGLASQTLSEREARQMVRCLFEQFRERDDDRIIDWDAIRHFEPTQEGRERFLDMCEEDMRRKMYGDA